MKIVCRVLIANLELVKIWFSKTKFAMTQLMFAKMAIFAQVLTLWHKQIAEKFSQLMMVWQFLIQLHAKEGLKDGISMEWQFIILVTHLLSSWHLMALKIFQLLTNAIYLKDMLVEHMTKYSQTQFTELNACVSIHIPKLTVNVLGQALHHM